MQYLLDTDTLIDFLQDRGSTRKRVTAFIEADDDVALCAITVAEVFSGLSEKNRKQWSDWLLSLSYWDIDWEAAMQAGIDRKQASESGRTLSVSDSLLASLARRHDATLLTSNIKAEPAEKGNQTTSTSRRGLLPPDPLHGTKIAKMGRDRSHCPSTRGLTSVGLIIARRYRSLGYRSPSQPLRVVTDGPTYLEVVMRMMLKAVFDTEAGNEVNRSGGAIQAIDQMVKAMQPEAFYAVGEDGQRAVLVVFDMADPSQLPVISEPLYQLGRRRSRCLRA